MWLAPAFSLVANAAARVYYRLTIAGSAVPRTGPVLLVANHPNSLIDPILVCAAARRPVRFLAKAPLFTDPKTALLVSAVGAIPVYRRVDDPALMDRNVDMFRAVYDALATDEAVGIFPEGQSHSESSMTTLKTGAARIALGTWDHHRTLVPIIPVGLVFRAKDTFRSQALVIIGQQVTWEDLAGQGASDPGAVRELTERIGLSLRRVTLNLETWEDQPVAECAVAIWEAEAADKGAAGTGATDAATRVQRLELATRILADIRREPDPKGNQLVRDVRDHARRLARLRLKPQSLSASTDAATAIRWTVHRFHLIIPFAFIAAVAGALLFGLPYLLTRWIVGRLKLEPDKRSTMKLLLGLVTYATWVLMLAAAALVGALMLGFGVVASAIFAAVTFVLVPAIGILGLAVRERWRGAWGDVRRFFLLRSRKGLIATLSDRQHALAERLKILLDERSAKVEV